MFVSTGVSLLMSKYNEYEEARKRISRLERELSQARLNKNAISRELDVLVCSLSPDEIMQADRILLSREVADGV